MIGSDISNDAACSLPQLVVNARCVEIIRDRGAIAVQITHNVGAIVNKPGVKPELLAR